MSAQPNGKGMGAIHSTKISDRSDREKRTTSKGGPVFSKLFRLDRTDPLSFGPKSPEILVEWIAPNIFVFSLAQIGIQRKDYGVGKQRRHSKAQVHIEVVTSKNYIKSSKHLTCTNGSGI